MVPVIIGRIARNNLGEARYLTLPLRLSISEVATILRIIGQTPIANSMMPADIEPRKAKRKIV